MATQAPIDEARYDAGRLAAQADALDARADALRDEARELAREAMYLRIEAERLTRAPLSAVPASAPSPSVADLPARVEAVLDGAGALAMSDLTSHLKASPARVRAALARLEAQGRVSRSGIKRGTRYRLAGEDEVAAKVQEFRSYEGAVRDAAVKLGTFELVDLQRELPELSEATVRRWVRRLEDRGIFASERVGVANVYAYVPPDAGPTHHPRDVPPEVQARQLAGRQQSRGDVVAGTGTVRAGSPIVNALIREVRPYGITVKRTSHKIVFMRDGVVIAGCSSTPGASSLKGSRAALRKAGVPVAP